MTASYVTILWNLWKSTILDLHQNSCFVLAINGKTKQRAFCTRAPTVAHMHTIPYCACNTKTSHLAITEIAQKQKLITTPLLYRRLNQCWPHCENFDVEFNRLIMSMRSTQRYLYTILVSSHSNGRNNLITTFVQRIEPTETSCLAPYFSFFRFFVFLFVDVFWFTRLHFFLNSE